MASLPPVPTSEDLIEARKVAGVWSRWLNTLKTRIESIDGLASPDLSALEARVSDVEDRVTALEGSGGGGGGSVAVAAFYMGGSSSAYVAPSPAAYVAIPNANYVTSGSDFTARLRVRLRAKNGGVGVRARLVRISGGIVITVGSPTSVVTSTTATDVEVAGLSIVTGGQYRVEILNSAAGEPVACESANLEAE